jgi:hypothetical protein
MADIKKHPSSNNINDDEPTVAASLPVSSLSASECPLCLSAYVDPRNLPCGHVTCLACLPLLRRADAPAGAAKPTPDPLPLHDPELRLCYFGCASPFSITNLPRAYALDALVQSRVPVDTALVWKAPQIHELFLIDTSSSMVRITHSHCAPISK